METILKGYKSAIGEALDAAEREQLVDRIWRREASVWKEATAHVKIIRNALGWLTVSEQMEPVASELDAFADEIRTAGFKHVMLCGMGGSSLCPEVLRQTFGSRAGYPELLVLDSTDPDVIAAYQQQIDLEHCLFIIASKSGTTIEPLVFYKYWFAEVSRHSNSPGDSFVAITDPGTPLVEEAESKGFRRVFLNQPDIGGRYSALSYFGMVPAALIGIDITSLLKRAGAMARACQEDARDNPAIMLGTAIGECAKAGRDKLTIVSDASISSLGLWIEQLIAESTGKEGKGVVPIIGEPLADANVYKNDRLFAFIQTGEVSPDVAQNMKSLAAADHPVISLTLHDLHDLAAQFFLWEFATAVAGWRLEIDPFDQPNVQEAKDATKELLESFSTTGKLPEPHLLSRDELLQIFLAKPTERAKATTVSEVIKAHLANLDSGNYVAFLQYLEETPALDAVIQMMRTSVRDATGCATTTGYGPRFLHSTGQLHKGGPETGVFIQIIATDKADFEIPGEKFTFSILKRAQALGDFQALASRGRRVIQVDVGEDAVAGLIRLHELIATALPKVRNAAE